MLLSFSNSVPWSPSCFKIHASRFKVFLPLLWFIFQYPFKVFIFLGYLVVLDFVLILVFLCTWYCYCFCLSVFSGDCEGGIKCNPRQGMPGTNILGIKLGFLSSMYPHGVLPGLSAPSFQNHFASLGVRTFQGTLN